MRLPITARISDPPRGSAKPHVIAGVNAFAADTEEEAAFLASSHFHWVNMLHKGRPCPLPHPQEGYLATLSDREKQGLQQAMACSVVGNKTQVGRWLSSFISATGADELIIDALSMIRQRAAVPISLWRRPCRDRRVLAMKRGVGGDCLISDSMRHIAVSE